MRLRFFLDPAPIEVEVTDGSGRDKTGSRRSSSSKCIIAAGSAAVHLPFIPGDRASSIRPERWSCFGAEEDAGHYGGGIIGLEMATVYSTLGSRVDVVEMLDGLMGPDRDAVRSGTKQNAHRFDKVMLKTKTGAVEGTAASRQVRRRRCPDRGGQVRHDPPGRRAAPTAEDRADKAGVAVTDRGFIPVDARCAPTCPSPPSQRPGQQPHAGHKAVHEAHVAAEVAAGLSRLRRQVIPGVASPTRSGVGRLYRGSRPEGRPQGRNRQVP